MYYLVNIGYIGKVTFLLLGLEIQSESTSFIYPSYLLILIPSRLLSKANNHKVITIGSVWYHITEHLKLLKWCNLSYTNIVNSNSYRQQFTIQQLQPDRKVIIVNRNQKGRVAINDLYHIGSNEPNYRCVQDTYTMIFPNLHLYCFVPLYTFRKSSVSIYY